MGGRVMADRTHTPASIVLGEGGWTVYPLPDPDARWNTTMISGYGRDWRDYLPHADPDCPIVDIRRALHDGADAVTFSVAGPMVGPTVPAGHLSSFAARGIVPFNPRPEVGRPERCAPLGNAHALDYAAPDVHARIARAMGVPVYTAAECLADDTLGDRP